MTTFVTAPRVSPSTGLAKTFPGPQGPVRAVRGVDLEIAPGETVALLGPNGAGKSTTIDMMLGLAPPDRGDVPLFGRGAGGGRRSRRVGRDAADRPADQRPLGPRAARHDGLALPGSAAGRRGPRADGAGPARAARTQKLSGGQTQRVRFALALVADPDLMVLDEPTVALDVEARHAFWATMRSSRRGHDRPVRHPLPGGGRRVRRPDRADGARAGSWPTAPPTEIKAQVGHAHDPGDAARRLRRRPRARCRAS